MHLALIAMSGIRALDTELLGLGLTLPGFVERSKTIASLPSLGLLTLAGQVPPWITMTYHECPDTAAVAALPERPDLVAISTFSAQVGEAYALADAYRARGVPVVMGGPHVSVLPDEALRHATTVVIGEGELVWPQVLADAERGALQPRYGRLGVAFDLAQSPLPRIDLLDLSNYNRLTVQTSRGCPHRCEFCASTPLMTAGYRMKPQARILAEIDQIRARWPRPFIEFADDNSFVDRPAWKRLLPELAKRDVPWFTETDISIADDLELVGMLRDAGCRQVLIGLESPVAAGLSGIELRGDWKRRRLDRYAGAIRLLQSHGISVNGCFPGQLGIRRGAGLRPQQRPGGSAGHRADRLSRHGAVSSST